MKTKLLVVLAVVAAIGVAIWLWLRSKKAGTSTVGETGRSGPNDNPVPGDDTSGEDPGSYTPVDDSGGDEWFPTDWEADPTRPADGIDVNDPAADDSTGSGVKPVGPPTVKPTRTGGRLTFKAPGQAVSQKNAVVTVPASAPDGTKWVASGGFGSPDPGGAKGNYSRIFISESGRYKMGVTYAPGGYAIKATVQDAQKKAFSAPNKAR